MTDEEMTNYIRHTDTYVKGYKDESSERDRKVSPIHDWMNENLMFDPDHWCAIGKKKKKPFGQEGTHSYPNWDSELYPSYLEHTEGTGNKPVTLSNFMSTLIEVCETMSYRFIKKSLIASLVSTAYVLGESLHITNDKIYFQVSSTI